MSRRKLFILILAIVLDILLLIPIYLRRSPIKVLNISNTPRTTWEDPDAGTIVVSLNEAYKEDPYKICLATMADVFIIYSSYEIMKDLKKHTEVE